MEGEGKIAKPASPLCYLNTPPRLSPSSLSPLRFPPLNSANNNITNNNSNNNSNNNNNNNNNDNNTTTDYFHHHNNYYNVVMPQNASPIALPPINKLQPLSPSPTRLNGLTHQYQHQKLETAQQTTNNKSPQPALRPFNHGLLFHLSVNLVETYSKINQKYLNTLDEFKPETEFDIKHGDILNNYKIHSFIGKGSFGCVMKAENMVDNSIVAIKIIKKNPMYYKQGLVEIEFLNIIKEKDPLDEQGFVRLYDHFEEGNHLFLVFEYLSINLFELIQKTQFMGVSLDLIRKFAYQILKSLVFLCDQQIIHSDLKPENILLCHPQKCAIKIIDFGSSCKSNEIIYKYTQSRFYRAPEVLLELDYDVAIDMWSVACILVELYTGTPLFSGLNEDDQLLKISEILGLPPIDMIISSPKQHVFFIKKNNQFSLKSAKGKVMPSSSLSHAIKRKKQTSKCEMTVFLDFIEKMLQFNPLERMNAADSLRHPFFTQSKEEQSKQFRRQTGNKRSPEFACNNPLKLQRRTQ